MSGMWPCRIVANEKAAERPGDMWPVTVRGIGSPHWFVRLPNGSMFDIHGNSSDGTPWDVSGEAPNFTAKPSISRQEIRHPDGMLWRQGWHGWLENGVLSADVEGRTYSTIIYSCFEQKGVKHLGFCSLPNGQPDKPGTGHMFGDVCYTLRETDGEIMWFERDENQPFLELD